MTSMTHESDERSFRYNPETGAYHTTYDWTSRETLSALVIRAVAATAGTRPTDLDERLADVIEVDALNDLFEPTDDGIRTANSGVWFEFSGHRVVVYADGEIEVRPVPSIAELDGSRAD